MIKTFFPETLVHDVFFSRRKLSIGCVNFLSSKDTKCSISSCHLQASCVTWRIWILYCYCFSVQPVPRHFSDENLRSRLQVQPKVGNDLAKKWKSSIYCWGKWLPLLLLSTTREFKFLSWTSWLLIAVEDRSRDTANEHMPVFCLCLVHATLFVWFLDCFS